MRLTREEYANLRLRRPTLFGPLDSLDASKHRQQARALERHTQAQQVRKGSMVRRGRIRVALIAAIPRRLDPDNLATSMKPLQDAIAGYLGIDDGDEDRITWEYGQTETRGSTGVVVKIERDKP